MSDEDVTIQNKPLLEEIRIEKDIRDGTRNGETRVNDGTRVSDRRTKSSNNGNRQDERGTNESNRRIAEGEGATESINRTTETVQRRIRPTDRQGIHSVKDSSYDDRRNEKVNGTFQLKNPFNFKDTTKKPIKLFTKIEADLEHDRLVEIYFRGSSLLDDILEIVVKDHEPVQIWQLDESESEMLAELHLARAQTNEDSARSARQLLAMYDRLYMYLLVGPRMVQTFKHIESHKGVSFK